MDFMLSIDKEIYIIDKIQQNLIYIAKKITYFTFR